MNAGIPDPLVERRARLVKNAIRYREKLREQCRERKLERLAQQRLRAICDKRL